MSPVGLLSRLVSAVTDARRASLIRIIIGIDAVLRGAEAREIMLKVSAPTALQLPIFDWLRVPAQPWLDLFIGAWVLLAAAFAVGWRTRWAGFALFAVMFASLFFDQQTFSNHLHFISIIVLLLSLAGAGARYSVDARMGRGALVIPEWPLTLLKIQLSLLYFFGSLSKINAVYLSGVVLESNLKDSSLISLPPELRTLEVCAILSVISVVADMALAFGLWLRRFRMATAVAGIVFHFMMVALLTSNLAGQLSMFAVACIALYLLFFPTRAPSPRILAETQARNPSVALRA